jgi:hypothetical protein
MYTLSEAAKATGLNRTTLFRAIRAGKISAARDAQGQWTLDPSEVHRVYPVVANDDAPQIATQHDASALQRQLEAKIAGLQQLAELLREQRDDALSQRDKWEQSFQATQRLLASPQSPATPVTKQPKPRSWWVALVLALLLALALALLAVDRLTISVDVGDLVANRFAGTSAAFRARDGGRARDSAVVIPDVHCPVGRRELLRRGPGLQSFPGRLELRLGRVEVLGRAHRESAGQMDGD